MTAALLLIPAVHSCIMEDRSHCPAYLTLDFSQTPEAVTHIHLIIRHSDGTQYSDTLTASEYSSLYEIPVRRGHVDVAAFGNVESMQYADGYSVTTGEEADNIYTCFFPALYDGDLCSDTVHMHKNNIGLHIRVTGHMSDNFHIVIESSSIGYDLQGNIIEGDYEHIPDAAHTPADENGYYEYSTRVVRQRSDDLRMTVFSDKEKPLKEISLSECLDEAGIHMSDPDLDDLYMTVDLERSILSVSPVGWTDTGYIEIII